MYDNTLESITPEEAINLYLRDRSTELSENTIASYRRKLTRLEEWCGEEGLTDLNDLSGRDLLAFKQSRSEDLSAVSLKGQMDTVRSFIRWCESIDAVETDLHNKVLSPSLNRGDRERDVLVETETAERALDYLARFEYASLAHTILTLLWRCGARTGTVRAFDLKDYDPEKEWLHAVHRDGTPLKNKERGERLISLSPEVCQVLSDYLDHNREEVADDDGRDPLLTTRFGRVSRSYIRETCYKWTRPCQTNGGDCPYGRDPDDCQALGGEDYAPSVCPGTRSPHAWRRGAITHHLTEDVPVDVVSDRMNVSREVLEDHYDRRPEEVKVEQRREYLSNL